MDSGSALTAPQSQTSETEQNEEASPFLSTPRYKDTLRPVTALTSIPAQGLRALAAMHTSQPEITARVRGAQGL